MDQNEMIMRRKARRLAYAQDNLAWLKALVRRQMDEEEILGQIDVLMDIVQNDDKKDCHWNT